MTRYARADRDLAALLADASPDVAEANAPALAALRAETAADLANAHVAAMLRTTGEASVTAARRLEGAAQVQPPQRAALDNAGSLGGAVPLEHDEQAALFAWAESNEAAHPELRNLFAIPNGGARHPAVAAQLKAEGVRRGVPDIMLAIMRRGNDGRTWGGLFVEMKRRGNKPTPEQSEWIARLRVNGYMAVVAYGCEEAKQCIMAYLTQQAQP